VLAARQTFRTIGSEVQQGLRNIPQVTTSTAGAAGILTAAGAVGANVYTAVTAPLSLCKSSCLDQHCFFQRLKDVAAVRYRECFLET
jgi:hypothetical protein